MIISLEMTFFIGDLLIFELRERMRGHKIRRQVQSYKERSRVKTGERSSPVEGHDFQSCRLVGRTKNAPMRRN
jgi:hypothetical protein